MIRSESGADLLNAPDLSVPFKMMDFEVPNIGGGFVVVNHYGDYILSAARIDMGVMGVDWRDADSALLYLHRTAGLTSTKCSATGLKRVGGAGALLYFKSAELDTQENRKVLLSALMAQLQQFTKTNILCLPGNLKPEDLVHMYKANQLIEEAEKKVAAEIAADQEEKKADSEGGDVFVPLGRKGRKGSFADASDSFEFPIPKALITQDGLAENVAAKSAAHSAFGSIVTLTKAKQWVNSRIVLLGVTPLSCELYHLLTRETDTVFLSDPDSSKYEKTNIPPLAF